MNKLYKFSVSYGRCGDEDGLFIADEEVIKASIGRIVHFGEILGKHSEVSVELKEHHFKVISGDKAYIDDTLYEFNSNTLCGYNPLDYLDNEDEE